VAYCMIPTLVHLLLDLKLVSMMIMRLLFPWSLILWLTPLTGLKEVIDPPLPPSPFVASSLSSTPRDTTENVLSLLSSPLSLAQSTRLEMGESLRGDDGCVEDDLLDKLGDIALSILTPFALSQLT